MSLPEPEHQLSRGMAKLREGDSLSALVFFEKAIQAGGAPVSLSCFGYCIAKERGQVSKGLNLCREALEKESGNPVHYLYMAKIHLLARQKVEALEVLRKGAALGLNDEIAALLEQVGNRKPPLVGFLSRDHPINKYLGIILAKLGRR